MEPVRRWNGVRLYAALSSSVSEWFSAQHAGLSACCGPDADFRIDEYPQSGARCVLHYGCLFWADYCQGNRFVLGGASDRTAASIRSGLWAAVLRSSAFVGTRTFHPSRSGAPDIRM